MSFMASVSSHGSFPAFPTVSTLLCTGGVLQPLLCGNIRNRRFVVPLSKKAIEELLQFWRQDLVTQAIHLRSLFLTSGGKNHDLFFLKSHKFKKDKLN